MGFNDFVKCAFHVEHHGVESATGNSLNRSGSVVQLGEPHGLSQAARRINGENAHIATQFSGANTNGGGRGCFAHATGTRADNDVN